LRRGRIRALIKLKKSTAKGRDRKLLLPRTNSANAIPLQSIGGGRGNSRANLRIPQERRGIRHEVDLG